MLYSEFAEGTGCRDNEMAKAAQDKRGDFSPAYTMKLSDKDARKVDGAMSVLCDFPDNKVCVFTYSFIREEVEE